MTNISIKQTEDGSHTLYNEKLDETYHSSHGAIQEANHVFIQNGIATLDKLKVSILEVGFGTGLNSVLTYLYGKDNKMNIQYTGLETYPLGKEVIDNLNYVEEIANLNKDIFKNIHEGTWGDSFDVSSGFQLKKLNVSLQEFEIQDQYDLIYYDAFGPRAQADMWEKELFEKLFESLKPNGKLVTYCAMGQFKRDLKSCGYSVESVPGPPGKREMTIAHKIL